MNLFKQLYQQIYQENKTFELSSPKRAACQKPKRRPNSIAIIGGALGDEGKGRAADEISDKLLKNHDQILHYRDNGGSNAGHTVKFNNTKIVLHQLGASILQNNATVVLGKDMVLHPNDLLTEIKMVKNTLDKSDLPAQLKIDEMAVLCLDTHRAFEAVLKMRSTGSQGATGRGISPAYADVIYRHPLRMRDLMSPDWQDKISQHYHLYQQLVAGCDFELAEIEVPRLNKDKITLGSLKQMLNRLKKARTILKPYVQPVHRYLRQQWQTQTPLIIEKAQGLGLDKRWGVYPDVTASNCGFDGITASSEGIIDHTQLAIKAITIKATYTSSVGARKLPTIMADSLAQRIREHANEYGATTNRPRDIVYIDLPMLSYLSHVSKAEELILTHLDISYPEVPIKVCIGYRIDGELVDYRPDQQYLNKVEPEYIQLPAWDGAEVQNTRQVEDLPIEAQQYVAFITQALAVEPFMLTVGPSRNQTIFCC